MKAITPPVGKFNLFVIKRGTVPVTWLTLPVYNFTCPFLIEFSFISGELVDTSIHLVRVFWNASNSNLVSKTLFKVNWILRYHECFTNNRLVVTTVWHGTSDLISDRTVNLMQGTYSSLFTVFCESFYTCNMLVSCMQKTVNVICYICAALCMSAEYCKFSEIEQL